MRPVRLAVLVALVGFGGIASAQSVYGDGDIDDGPYGDSPLLREQTPEPPPPPRQAQARTPDSPYQLLDQRGAPAAPDPGAQQFRYNGPHAINADYGAGWCNLSGAHVHQYPPFDDHLFQEDQGGYDFLGDPVDFGYTGDVFWYNGVHPIAAGWGTGWCYMGTPHRHIYRPWGVYFSNCGSFYCFYGPYDAMYWHYRGYWAPFWGSYYPYYYRGGLYGRTGVAASPGRWGGRGPGGRGVGAGGAGVGRPAAGGSHAGTTAGRPGGYSRPTQAMPKLTRPMTLNGRIGTGPGYAVPRMAAPPMRSYGAPGYRTPGYGMPRYGSPRFSAPHYAAPRYSAPHYSSPRFSAPSGGGFRGGGFRGGGFRGGGRR